MKTFKKNSPESIVGLLPFTMIEERIRINHPNLSNLIIHFSRTCFDDVYVEEEYEKKGIVFTESFRYDIKEIIRIANDILTEKEISHIIIDDSLRQKNPIKIVHVPGNSSEPMDYGTWKVSGILFKKST